MLANRLVDIGSELNAQAPDTGLSQEGTVMGPDVDRRMRLAHEWDELVEQVTVEPVPQ